MTHKSLAKLKILLQKYFGEQKNRLLDRYISIHRQRYRDRFIYIYREKQLEYKSIYEYKSIEKQIDRQRDRKENIEKNR